MKRRDLFFILLVGIVGGAFFSLQTPTAQASECCCVEIEVVGGAPIQDCKVLDECALPYLPTDLDPLQCAGVNTDIESSTTSDPIYFTPNAPIPGVFEGPQEVDGTLLSRYIRSFYIYFVWIVGILAVVMTMYAGIQWLTAAGNTSQIENAKSTMNGALVGLVLTLTSYIILQAINPALVTLQDLSIFSVPSQLIGEKGESSARGDTAAGLPESIQDLSGVSNVTKWDDLIRTISNENNVNPYYVKAIMMIESRGNANAISPVGACGLMQVMPANANGVCLVGEARAEENIRAGVNLIARLIRNTCPSSASLKSGKTVECNPQQTNCYNGSWHYVIAAYNGGVGANCSSQTCAPAGPGLKGQTWWECTDNGGFAETRNYVKSVEKMYTIVQGWGGLN
ncbi:MAG: transglycosylase SLT domain-containing protein [Candidatus Nomurabacteria bacterium]|nr:MAG: transglycosylase SLT domain-containing protein [Candidatus Nomurabacteria bacterium]